MGKAAEIVEDVADTLYRPFDEAGRELTGANRRREAEYQGRVIDDATKARQKLLMQEQEFMKLQDEAASSGAAAIRNTANAKFNATSGKASISAVMPKEERDFLGL